MGATVGDTSKTHVAARFIAIAEESLPDGGPLHAKVAQRLARDSNWLECNVRQAMFCQPFDDSGALAANAVSAPTRKIIMERPLPQCFGPWLVYTHRPELTFEIGYGLKTGASAYFYWELFSEQHGPDWTPSAEQWTEVNNAGATGWFEVSITKTVRPGVVDWARLWVMVPMTVPATLAKGVNTGTVDAAGLSGRGQWYVVCKDGGGAYIDYDPLDFEPEAGRMLLFFETATTDPLLVGPFPTHSAYDPSPNPATGGLKACIEALSGRPGNLTAPDLVGKVFEIHEASGGVSLRYVHCFEPRLTSVAEGQPFRRGFLPVPDEMGNSGEPGLRDLACVVQGNTDLLRNAPLVVHNQAVATVGGQAGGQVTQTRYVKKLNVNHGVGGTWTSILFAPMYLEQDYEEIAVQLWYHAGSANRGIDKLQARLRVKNWARAVQATLDTKEFPYEVMAPPGFVYSDGTVAPQSDSANVWPGPWWLEKLNHTVGPVWVWPVSSYAGTFVELDLQLRTHSDARSEVTIHPLSWVVMARPRR